MRVTLKKRINRARRHLRVRKKVNGTQERPRLTVFRSARHIYCQVVDDMAGHTLASASTQSKEIREQIKYAGNVDAAKLVGDLIARKATEAGVKAVVFDRGGYRYHGRIKALAENARKAGLVF